MPPPPGMGFVTSMGRRHESSSLTESAEEKRSAAAKARAECMSKSGADLRAEFARAESDEAKSVDEKRAYYAKIAEERRKEALTGGCFHPENNALAPTPASVAAAEAAAEAASSASAAQEESAASTSVPSSSKDFAMSEIERLEREAAQSEGKFVNDPTAGGVVVPSQQGGRPLSGRQVGAKSIRVASMQRRVPTVPANLAHPALAHEHLRNQEPTGRQAGPGEGGESGGEGVVVSPPPPPAAAKDGSGLVHSSEATYSASDQQQQQEENEEQFYSERNPVTYADVPRELEKQLRLNGTTFSSQEELEKYVSEWRAKQASEEHTRERAAAAQQKQADMCKKQESDRLAVRAEERKVLSEELDKEVLEKAGEKEKDTARRETIAEEERKHADELRSRYRR